MNSSKKINFIDLFSGCGGFSSGFELRGHRCLLGVDFNRDAMNTFSHNHPDAEIFCGDIRDLTTRKIKSLVDIDDIDLIIGGPPCQGFSTVGAGKAEDIRNYLFLEFLRIVKLVKPKVLVIENVTGLLAKKNEKTLNKIFSVFEKIGYQVDARVLSSEEYGVPEKRRRTIIIGTQKGYAPVFPEITHGLRGEKQLKTVGDALKNLRAKNGEIYNHHTQSARVSNELDEKRLSYIPEGRGIRYERDEKAYLPENLRYEVEWGKLKEGRFRQTKLQRLCRKKPSYTIMTSRTSYYHPVENRYLTAREAASIQSFSNDFVFMGSLTSQFRQIGNAVPPLMAYAIALAVEKSLQGKVLQFKKKENFKKYAFRYQEDVA